MSVKKQFDMSPAQIKGLPGGKSDFFDHSAMNTTKPMQKKQQLLAGTFKFNQDEGIIGNGTDPFPLLSSKNTIVNRRKELEDLLKVLDVK